MTKSISILAIHQTPGESAWRFYRLDGAMRKWRRQGLLHVTTSTCSSMNPRNLSIGDYGAKHKNQILSRERTRYFPLADRNATSSGCHGR